MRAVLTSGTKLSHFEIVSHIGAGGMGDVYSAVDLELGRRVAIKVLPVESTRDESRIARFVQEAKAASALNHPHIVTVYEIGRADDHQFIAMELVDGQTLRDRLGRNDDPESLIPVFLQVAEGLDKAHSAGIVHRDLKPENIMLTADGYAKILDFGLAKLVQPDMSNPNEQTTAQNLTREGTVVGTMGYMSPEQLRGERVDHRTDIFAFGCILYEAFAGQQPFRGQSQVDTIHNVLHETPRPVRAPKVQRIIAKAIAKKPEERYTSAREVANELRAVSSPATARAPRRIPLVAFALALLALIVTGGVLLLRRPEKAPRSTFDKMQIVPLEGTSRIGYVAISPDGKYIVYTRDHALTVRQLASGAESTVARALSDPSDPLFSADGGTIFFHDKATIFAVPVLGGAPRQLVANVGYGGITFSPDGRRIAFPRKGALFMQDVDGSNLRRVAGTTVKDNYANPRWSSDPNVIAAVRRSFQGVIGSRVQRIHMNTPDLVAAAAAAPDFFNGSFPLINGIEWLPDHGGVVASAATSYVAPAQLYILSSDNSKPVRITNDLFGYEDISVTADGATIAAAQSDQRWTVAEVPLHASAPARQIAEGSGSFSFVSVNGAGDIVYDVPSENGVELWVVRHDGARQMITTDPNPVLPQFSPDGRSIAYLREIDRRVNVWRIGSDGSSPKQITFGNFVRNPRWSADGQFIYCTSRDSGHAELWKVPADGGKPVIIDTPYAVRPAPSPDGKTIAAVTNYGWQLALIDAQSGRLIKELPATGIGSQLHWTPDGRRIAFPQGPNVVAIDTRSGVIETLTKFDSGEISSFDWMPGGTSLICTRTTESRRVVLLRGFH